MSASTLLGLTIIFAAAFVRVIFGFGDALVAMPLLTLAIGVHTATPLMGLISASIALTIAWYSRREIQHQAAWRLVISSVAGIPLGVLVLRYASEGLVKGVLGGSLILYGLYSLFRPPSLKLDHPQWAYVFGFVAGILGGAYNANGPPVVVYGSLRRWPPQKFRATLQGYFVPTSLLILASHALGGLWTLRVFELFLLALPAVFAAIWLGSRLNRHLHAGRFTRLLYAVLILLGIVMLI